MNTDRNQFKISHFFLVEADTSINGMNQVRRYLEGNQLITYTDLVIRDDEVVQGDDARFWPSLEQGVAKNMEFARSMVNVLREEGVTTVHDLLRIREGYLTKVLHTLTHILDGFIGVDTVFYNLIEDSHRVSGTLKQAIERNSTGYWLIAVRTGMLEASVLHLKKQ